MNLDRAVPTPTDPVQDEIDYPVLDRAITEALERGRIPGAGIAIVKGDELLFVKGYGHTGIEPGGAPIGPQTFYPPASTIKAMTSTVIGMLVDDGLLAWDKPIRRYLPAFSLADEAIAQAVTLRDLLTMRTGLPAHEYVWMANDFDRAALLERLPHLPFSAGLGERFQYNNLGFAIAGHAAERVVGQDWEDLMRDRLFGPLGMEGARFERPRHSDVVDSYHEDRARRLVRTEPWLSVMIGPAGGTFYATLGDMARWASFNLQGGRVGQSQLISPVTFGQIMRPAIAMGQDGAAPSRDAHYALGWFVDQHRGARRISHTGYLDDVNSCVTLFPGENLGIVSYTTFASSRLAILLSNLAFDIVCDGAPDDAISVAQTRYEASIEAAITGCSVGPGDEVAVFGDGAHVGTYHHPAYGTIQIGSAGNGLELRWNHLRFVLRPLSDRNWVAVDQAYFEIHKPNPFDDDHPLLFEFDDDGKCTALLIALEPAVPAIRFAHSL
jgi:CubicO group peptidase (beta-lactamase class C family)